MRKIKFKRKPLKVRDDLETFYVDSELQAYLLWYEYDKRREEQEAERQKRLAEEAAELQRQENWNTMITNLRRLCNATN